MTVLLSELCDAIESTLSAATGINRAQSYDELTNGIPDTDLPMIQVYWEDLSFDAQGETDRATFGGGRRIKRATIRVDLYGARLVLLGENMETMLDAVDALVTVLEQQNYRPYFGESEIQAWAVTSFARASFEAPDANTYIGARAELAVWFY